ncbi:MAG: HPF/RaiA family ribosome-associated protein [Proteobacteria bacterium]|nr:HPF/RaiA family ribosome-associated protein [Pseudomonadota bacterium]
MPVDASDRVYLRSKLAVKLGKFGRAIARASVRIADANGPRGGADKTCTIKVVLIGEPSVVVVEQHTSLKTAMDAAMQRAAYAVGRVVQRRSDSRKSPAAGSMA